jgi:hypothetical protein
MLLHTLEDEGPPAAGAILKLEIAGQSRLRPVQRTYSYCACNDARLYVGSARPKPSRACE